MDSTALFAALRRLDRRLERAVAAADAAYGSAAASDPYRGLYVCSDEVQRCLAREPGAPVLAAPDASSEDGLPEYAPLTALCAAFALEPFEADVLLLALAPEVDLRYERLYAYLQDDVARRRPSVDLALNLLCGTRAAKLAGRARFAPDAPLLKHQLLQLVSDGGLSPAPLLAQSLKLDDAVARFLLGQPALDARLLGCTRHVEPAAAGRSPLPAALAARLVDLARQAESEARALRLSFEGPRGGEKRAAARALAAALDRPLLEVAVGRIPPAEFEASLALLLREARLRRAWLFLDELDVLRETERGAHLRALESALDESPAAAILAGERPWPAPAEVVVVAFLPGEFGTRRAAWAAELETRGFAADASLLDSLAARYRLGRDQIAAAAAAAANQSRLDGRVGLADELAAAARAQARHDLGPLARRVQPVAGWDDIVLPPQALGQLRELCHQARFRHVVYGEWGFDRKLSLGKGLSALFSGPPGTGKTMAAEVVARDLGLELYKIDLSSVVSKYIGETEKNLNRVFAEARAGNVVLLFDECDALFGKRTEVRDAHDRYANIEVAYLLQKMEEHDGLCILATNLRQNLDAAFLRRLTFAVEFPFPDEAQRRRIWRSIWPQATPLAPDLDLDFMAAQFKLSGGGVKNVAVAAAFLAAAEGACAVGQEHLLHATRRELEKSGHTVSRGEFGRYGGALPAEAAS